jgi:hypothetical protein
VQFGAVSFPSDLFESCTVSTRGYDVTSDHVYTTRSLYRAAAVVTGKHRSRYINNRNNVTVEHRDVVSTEDKVTVPGTRAVKYIILFGVATLLQKTWKQRIITGLLARVVKLLNCIRQFCVSYILLNI